MFSLSKFSIIKKNSGEEIAFLISSPESNLACVEFFNLVGFNYQRFGPREDSDLLNPPARGPFDS